MRLFAAVVPPPDVLAELVDATVPLRTELSGSRRADAVPMHVRWADAARMHLTLAFYGEVADAVVPRLTERLTRVAGRGTAMDLRFAGGGAFPNARRARARWVGVEGDRDPLRRLAASAVAAGRRLRLGGQDRAYRPHLTLARLREPADVRAHVDKLAAYRGRSWRATELVLVRSHLGPAPKHETLASWPLGR
ncbi:MAG: RNA 2',3'-cyclic phosphodiesterase [Acidothermales bacterium]|nr:RNA 2',3'-cyclic phosphodiesterase [Acidothermales bacterium]